MGCSVPARVTSVYLMVVYVSAKGFDPVMENVSFGFGCPRACWQHKRQSKCLLREIPSLTDCSIQNVLLDGRGPWAQFCGAC